MPRHCCTLPGFCGYRIICSIIGSCYKGTIRAIGIFIIQLGYFVKIGSIFVVNKNLTICTAYSTCVDICGIFTTDMGFWLGDGV